MNGFAPTARTWPSRLVLAALTAAAAFNPPAAAALVLVATESSETEPERARSC